MHIASIQYQELGIPFRTVFKHASAERRRTEAVWVEAQTDDGKAGFGEGCPRSYVTGETLQTAAAFVGRHRADWLAKDWDVTALSAWTEGHRAEIDANPAAWTAVELALLDLLGRAGGKPVETLLQLPSAVGVYSYTAVLGDLAPAEFDVQLRQYLQAGFRTFKLKLSRDPARNRTAIHAFTAAGISPQRVRLDANNFWTEANAAIRELAALKFPFWAIEEPLSAGDLAGVRAVADATGAAIVLDETLLRSEQIGALAADAERWIINLRVSKMGGLLRSLEVLREARRQGIKIVLGAHVGESSVLTRAALTLATVAGDALVGQEGAFGTLLLAEDVIDPPLMFGRGGELRFEQPGSGFGLPVDAERLRRLELVASLS